MKAPCSGISYQLPLSLTLAVLPLASCCDVEDDECEGGAADAGDRLGFVRDGLQVHEGESAELAAALIWRALLTEGSPAPSAFYPSGKVRAIFRGAPKAVLAKHAMHKFDHFN